MKTPALGCVLALLFFALLSPALAQTEPGANSGINGTVYALAVQPDGKIVVGGEFSSVNNTPRSNLARLNPDGSLDASFVPKFSDGPNGTVYALAIDANGNLLVGGMFSMAAEVPRRNFVRYMTDGTVDKNFDEGQSPNGMVKAIAVLPDGSIVIGGEFSEVGSVLRRNIAIFGPDSTLMASTPEMQKLNGTVRKLAPGAAGEVVAVGQFQITGSQYQNAAILKVVNP